MSFGTDLSFAYSGETNAYPQMNMHDQIETEQKKSKAKQINQFVAPPTSNFNGNEPLSNIGMEEQVNILKHELLKEKLIKKNNSSIVSKFINKKKDMIKILQLSLVILLALSIHFMLKHYVKLHILENDYNTRKEFLFRLSYPLIIFVIIWITKVFKFSENSKD